MKNLKEEARAFLERGEKEWHLAQQRRALLSCTGTDLEVLESLNETDKLRLAAQLMRLAERERLKGVRGHWSYDFNRHVALRQLAARLTGAPAVSRAGHADKRHRPGRGQRKRQRPGDAALFS